MSVQDHVSRIILINKFSRYFRIAFWETVAVPNQDVIPSTDKGVIKTKPIANTMTMNLEITIYKTITVD